MKYKELFDKVKLDPNTKERIKDRIFTLNFKAEIGNEEKHIVDVIINQFWGCADILVDGHRYKYMELGKKEVKQNWIFEFNIGETEIHTIRIEFIKSLVPIGMKELFVSIYVDGDEIKNDSNQLRVNANLFGGLNIWSKVKILITTLLAITMIATLIIHSIPISIDKEMNGILFRGGSSEPAYIQPINIKIEGKYYIRLATEYLFEGDIDVREFQYDEVTPIKQKKGLSFIITNHLIEGYWDSNSSFGHSIDGGFLYLKPGTDKTMIIVFEIDKDGQELGAGGENALYFVAPCSTREEALEIVNEFYLLLYKSEFKPIK